MYEANAETARLEQSLQHLRDSRRRVDNQIAAVSQERTRGQRASTTRCRRGLAEQRAALDGATEQLEACREQERLEAQQLPAAEQAVHAPRAARSSG